MNLPIKFDREPNSVWPVLVSVIVDFPRPPSCSNLISISFPASSYSSFNIATLNYSLEGLPFFIISVSS